MTVRATTPFGALGRADLLRLLAVADCDSMLLDHNADGWFGYVHRARDARSSVDLLSSHSATETSSLPVATGPRPKLQMSFVCAVVERMRLNAAAATLNPGSALPILAKEDVEARQAKRQVEYEDLIPAARLMPALMRTLAATRSGPVDVERLVQAVATNRFPRCLPRQPRRGWHPDLVVVLDFCDRLFLFREDMHRLARHLLSACGSSAVSLRIINHGPSGPWSDWVAEQNRKRLAPRRPWRALVPGTPVLIVSDLGLALLEGEGSLLCQEWQAFIRRLKQTNTVPIALAPISNSQIGALPRLLPVLRWSPDARLRPVRVRGGVHPPEGLQELLAMVAATRRVDPPLLRAMRRLNSKGPNDAGLEGAVWSHPHVAAATVVHLRREHAEVYLHTFSSQPPSRQLQLHELHRLHHAHLPRALEHEEVLHWAAHVDWQTLGQRSISHVASARRFLQQLLRTVSDPDVSPEAKEQWTRVISAVLQRAEPNMHDEFFEELGRLHEVLAPYSGDAELLDCWIVGDAHRGEILVQVERAGPRQYPMSSALSVDAAGLIVRVHGMTPDSRILRVVSRSELPVVVGNLHGQKVVQLKTSRDSVTLGPIRRPRGIERWWCDREGIHLQRPSLCRELGEPEEFRSLWHNSEHPQGMMGRTGANLDFIPAAEVVREGGEPRQWYLRTGDPHPLASRVPNRPFFGFDEFGLYGDLLIEGRFGRAQQRFRRIEPGTFWMGSPLDEPERGREEEPQHLVTLTRGVWLADTACTQGLWAAVMGSNPSRHQGEELPVGGVSWDDAQQFLRELEELLKDCPADLPTEAEWEYACRAGTTTPFSFGTNITTEQVNYDGRSPYAGAAKGEYRRMVLPVKSLPPNPWGLYEMHGNVFEWCADPGREYLPQPVIDPRGSLKAGSMTRAGRGGSWYYGANWARSACRFETSPADRHHWFGFRICLRSDKADHVRANASHG